MLIFKGKLVPSSSAVASKQVDIDKLNQVFQRVHLSPQDASLTAQYYRTQSNPQIKDIR